MAPRLEDAAIRQTTWRIAKGGAMQSAANGSTPTATKSDRDRVRLEALARLWSAAARSSDGAQAASEHLWQRRLSAALAIRQARTGADLASLAELLPPSTDGNDAPSLANPRSYVIVSAHAAAGETVAILASEHGAERVGRFGPDAVLEAPASQARRFADQLQRDAADVERPVVVANSAFIGDRAEWFERAFAEREFESFAAADAMWAIDVLREPTSVLPPGRWWIALGIVAVGAACLCSAPRRRAAEWFARQPHFALTALGVVWWLVLAPGWIGLALIVAGIAFAWRTAWKLPQVPRFVHPSSHA
jgi:hypothetical protein